MSSSTQNYDIPDGYLYTKDHEWLKMNKKSVLTVGITDYAAKMLHDIVYVVLPAEGTMFKCKDVFGQVESVKTVSDVYMPISGKVTKTNQSLAKTPEVISSSPYEDGWMLEVQASNYENEAKQLLEPNAYRMYIEELRSSES
ncbi:MAG: glycine cleavage system protein GcvH [Nitrososphaerales archaeon]